MSASLEVAAAGAGQAAAGTARRAAIGRRAATLLVRSASFIAFAAVLAVFAWQAPFFLSVANVGNVLGQSAILGTLAIGLTIVVIGGGSNVVTGGIDLSIAANMGLSAAVYASLIQAGADDGTAAAGALATGLAIGLVNALSVTLLGIVPLLATLAVMNVVAGLELVLTQNTVVPAATDFLSVLSGYGPWSVPVLAFVFVGIAAVFFIGVQQTRIGLHLYAVGEFPEAARAAGLPVRRLVAGSYLVCGLTGGIGGILSVAYLSGSTTGSGEMLLSVVVTALLGVVFSRRLVPTIGGTVLSALFVGFLINGFQLLNISSYWVSGVQGVLILLVVAATSLLRRNGSAP
ncbi:ABC transporter permease [Labrys wisconsinensis]|uniref:Ribose transport system permease protein n=1 Tax=Labrys wisconsinensis TaxID=425677 RepID=A0ABU0J3H7_9HYPH|nr:ABC transporter permease [Labrys wisconsinensis]MDQ0468815.1 ribose transport system permease protein [Labrys wisconsinensis]